VPNPEHTQLSSSSISGWWYSYPVTNDVMFEVGIPHGSVSEALLSK